MTTVAPGPRPAAGPATLDIAELLKVDFSPEQLAAIQAPLEPFVIVAGAGSGKTSVMAARVAWLVAMEGVQAESILGMTFTNKAAAELARRVTDALRLWHLSTGGVGEEPSPPTVATYHSYASRLIGDHALRIGLEPGARLLADASRWQLAQRVVRRASGPFHALGDRRPVDLVDDLIRLDAELSEHLLDPATVREHDREVIEAIEQAPKLTADLKDIRTRTVKRLELLDLVEDYRAAKLAHDVLDFGDQVALGARLAETRPEVGVIERERYAAVLLDEYQDTSVAQRRMLASLYGDGHPVTAVGDPLQSIYGWRGAAASNIDQFPAHFPRRDGSPARVFTLGGNFRSGGRLLTLANRLAEPLREHHRSVPVLTPKPGAADAGHTICALFERYDDEVAWVASEVARIVGTGVAAPGSVAILTRVTSDFPALVDALGARGLPVEVVGLSGLLSLPEVADVVATLRVLDDPTANASLVRLLTGPRWRIGPRDLVALGRRAARLVRPRGDDDSELEGDVETALEAAVSGVDPAEVVALADALDDLGPPALYSPEAYSRLRACAAEFARLRRTLSQPLVDVVHEVVTATGLDVELAASAEAVAARRADNVATFLAHAASFTGIDSDNSLTAFLAFLKVAEQYDRGLDTEGPTGSDAVKLMTVHKAKGLEWDVVVLPNLCAGVFPTAKGRERWTTSHVTVPYPLRGDAADLPVLAGWTSAAVKQFELDCRAMSLREERRLAYVGVTRPRRMLLASGHWWGPTQKRPRGPSEFLSEIRDACVSSGVGYVVEWASPPPDGATNPRLDEPMQHQWPAPFRPEAFARRQEAAAAVRRHLGETAEAPDDAPAGEAVPGDVAGGVAATGEATAGGLAAAGEAGDAPVAPIAPGPLSAEEQAVAAGWDADLAVLLADLREQRVRERLVPLPRVLTASHVVDLARDPDAFARTLARPLPRPPARQARRGTAFHSWVEARFAQRPLLGPDDLPGAQDAGIEDDAELEALQAAFEASEWADRVPVAMEAPFELALGGFVLRGRIDAIYATSDGGFDVIDYKTGRVPDDLESAALQLSVYRHAWAGLRGVDPARVTAGFLYVRKAEVIRPPLLDEGELVTLLAGRPPGQVALF